MLLAEWRRWWDDRGRCELRLLLAERWDPFEEEAVVERFEPILDELGDALHQDADRVDVQRVLENVRLREQGRMGRRWTRRDRRVAEAVMRWYADSTRETPDRHRAK